MDIEIKKLPVFSDSRGILSELMSAVDAKKHKGIFGHLFFVTFRDRSSIRGNHYHKIAHEYYIPLLGRIRVILTDIKTKKKKTVTISSNQKYITRLRIGPNIAHACFSVTPSTIMVGYFSNAYDKSDTVEYILIKKR